MVPISIKNFVDQYSKTNKGVNKRGLIEALEEAVSRKRNGAKCFICDEPIWALGSVVVGFDMCFTCHTQETDPSTDYEIEGVCYE